MDSPTTEQMSVEFSHSVNSNLSNQTRDSYTVGIICALDVELAAAMAMLDDQHKGLPQAQGDSNAYILGRIAQHNVVLTCLPAGTTGTNAAANAATNMSRSFPNIHFGLMVGIGGGAPIAPSDDTSEDIRLGDVVVSCPSANSGGVLQYDFGKTMSEGKFVQTGVLNKPSRVLSNSVSTLRARHRIEESRIPQFIRHMLESNRKMQREFSHPGLEHDQLFRADSEHRNGEPTCHSCDTEALVVRKSRENTDPVVHYGLIGSANQVMKHGATRDKLRDEKNIICFEMEAAGLMDVLPCLVVRGICDYADSHKNKRWQPYAAATAAACAKEILFSTPAPEFAVEPSFNGEAIYNMLQATLYEFNLDQLLNVLPVSNYRHHKPVLKSMDHEDPKFDWVLRNADFSQWSLERGFSMLCLTGPLLENILCQLSLYIMDLKKAAGYFVLPIFCSAMERNSSIATFLQVFVLELIYCSPEEQRTPIIRSFFSKLLEKPKVRDHREWKEKTFNEDIFLKYMRIILKRATVNELLTWLKAALDFGMERRLLVIIDALYVIRSMDESLGCVIPLLEHIQQRYPDAKILLTSSEKSKTLSLFQDCLHIEYDKERNECLKSLQFDNTRYDKVSEEHEGSFGWIWTHKEYESWCASDTSRLLYVQGKPGSGKSTLTKYFNRNLCQRQPSARKSIIARFFYSFREGELQRSHHSMLSSIIYDILQQEESFFYHKCQIEYRAHQRYGHHFKWDYDSLKRILKSLQDYLTTKRFYLIIDAIDESQEKDRREILGLFLELCSKTKHSVVKVFMASRPVAQLEARRDQFHSFIKLDDETRSDIYNYAQSKLDGLNSTDLLAQATEHILENAQGVFLWVKLISEQLIEAHEQGYSEEKIFELLKQLPTELEEFYELMLEKMKHNEPSILHAAKIFRFILFARRPLTVDEILHALGIPDSVDSDSRFIPSDNLLEKRIPSSERVILSSGGNFLEIKKHNGNKIVQIMHQTVREFFLNPDGPVASSNYRISETHAHMNIAITCIRYLSVCAINTCLAGNLPNINSWDTIHYKDYCQYLNRRPLASYALGYIESHVEICKYDANVKYTASQLIEQLTNGDPGASLLERWAISGLHQCSLSKNNVQGATAMKFRGEILRFASIYGFYIAAELLLLAETDVDARNEDGRTPLSLAASNGHEAIAKLLLDGDAAIDMIDNIGQTPLTWAIMDGQRDIVILLFEYGANIEKEDDKNRTPLSWAVVYGHLAIVRFLVEKGANIEHKDSLRKTPLLLAIEKNYLDIVRFLVEIGANLEDDSDIQNTPLLLAVEKNHLDIVGVLVEEGANIERSDAFFRTPLSCAAEHGHLDIVRFLVENDASVERWDRFGKTSLSWAVEHGHLAIVRFLAEKGAKIEYGVDFCKAPLLLAVEKGHLEIVKFLAEKGANIDIKDDHGKTLVSRAVEDNRLDIVKFLIEMC